MSESNTNAKTEMGQPSKSIWRREILPETGILSWPRSLFRWLFSWRGLRHMLIALIWTATVIALWYGEENWRGGRVWNKYRRELEAHGEQLDLKAFIPKPVPDEQNFAAVPFVQSWFLQTTNPLPQWKDNDNYAQASSMLSGGKLEGGRRQFDDLPTWEKAFEEIRTGKKEARLQFHTNRLDSESRAKAAPAVIAGLKTNAAVLADLRAASQRPYSHYPVVYNLDNPWGILLPHLANVKAACLRLQLRACAELAAGESEKALEDVDLILRLADSMKEEPFLISYLVRLACLQVAVQPVWEGLAEHHWSEAQLQELQRRFQQFDFVADMKRPFEAERAAGVLTVDLLIRKKYNLPNLGYNISDGTSSGEFEALIAKIIPRGWYYQEQLNYCRIYQVELGGTFDPAGRRIFPGRVESNNHEFERELSGGRFGRAFSLFVHHRVISAMLLPALSNVIRKTAPALVAVDEAAMACALERYRLAHGQYPERLEALVPKLLPQLPNDVFTGAPYKYRRTEDDQFALYSVGWDEKDDGGVPGKTLFDEKQGDWVWEYPAR